VIAASTSSAAVGSSAEVGSSSTSTRGWGVSTEPIATLCCWPPEIACNGRYRSSASPSRSSVSSTRLRITSTGTASCSMPYASSSSTTSVTNPANGSCPTTPTMSANSRGGWVAVSRPSTTTRPSNTPPVKCGTRPLIAPSSVDLPAPVRPTTRHSSPSSIRRFTLRNTGAGASLYVMVTRSNSITPAPSHLAVRPCSQTSGLLCDPPVVSLAALRRRASGRIRAGVARRHPRSRR
jgi:hypothetical protein